MVLFWARSLTPKAPAQKSQIASDTRKMLREVHVRFMPHKILMVVGEGGSRETLMRWLPFLKGVTPVKGKATAYVCVDYACELPTSDLPTFQAILDGKQPRGG